MQGSPVLLASPRLTPPRPPQIEKACALRAAAGACAAATADPAAMSDGGGDGADGASGAGVWTAFVEGLLRVDPSKRYSAHQALSRDIFESDAVADRAASRRKKSVSRDASPTLLAELRHAAHGIPPADAGAVQTSPPRRRNSVSRDTSPERLAPPAPRPPLDLAAAAAALAATAAASGRGPEAGRRVPAPAESAPGRGSSMGGLIKKFAPLVSDMFGGGASAAARSRAAAAAATAATAPAGGEVASLKPAALNYIAPPRPATPTGAAAAADSAA
jgi:hypothetical protein